jgi:hypothetical protein
MEVVEVTWFGMDLLEPMTGITDILIAVFCTYFGVKLYRKSKKKIATYWSLFFFVMAVATFIGGFAHAFLNYLGPNAHLVSRSLTVFGLFFAEMASFLTIVRLKLRNSLIFVSVLKMIIVLYFIILHNDFVIVKINSLISLIGIVYIIHIVSYFKDKNYTGKMISAAIGCGILAALVNTFKLSLHQWFSYHDVAHMFMIGSFYFFFKGVSDSNYLLRGADQNI